jgi:hypothetical protein
MVAIGVVVRDLCMAILSWSLSGPLQFGMYSRSFVSRVSFALHCVGMQ